MNEIKSFLKDDLKLFEENFKIAVKSKVALLDKIMQYVVRTKGKQLRPMFVLLAAKMNGEINEKVFRAASLIELLHTATLVHDDVVDDSNQRRGFFSINALWKNKIAVLVGDYLLSKGLLLSLGNKDFEILEILAEAVKDMAEGELLQAEKARKLDITEEIYFDIIRCKTASLISSAFAAGAFAASSDVNKSGIMRKFGEKVGIAFQIRDDLFDYGKADVGKPTGNDIKEKKMTLPLIHALNNTDKSTKRRMINIVRNHNEDPKRVAEVIDFVLKSNGLKYANERMHEYKDKALAILHEFPENEARRALEGLVLYTVAREK